VIDLGKTILLPLATTLALAACGGPATPPETPAAGDDAGGATTTALPDSPPGETSSGGAGADLVAARCVGCHDVPVAGKLTQDELGAKLDSAHETVELTADERQAIIDHLAKP
jgi:cytochrome c5